MELDRTAFTALRRSTCAVMLLDGDPRDPATTFQSARFRIAGTAFLVAPGIALTNRHVALNLEAAREKASQPDDRRFLVFCAPANDNDLSIKSVSVTHMTVLGNTALDLAVAYFSPPGDDTFWAGLKPVEIANFSAVAGDEVGVIGFPFGESAFARDEGDVDQKRYRFGATLHRGWVADVAPFDEASTIDRVLLDVRTAVGMSGGPVFRPSDGRVIGIHYAGRDATLAYAVPLSPEFLAGTLEVFRLTELNTTKTGDKYGPITVSKVRRTFNK